MATDTDRASRPLGPVLTVGQSCSPAALGQLRYLRWALNYFSGVFQGAWHVREGSEHPACQPCICITSYTLLCPWQLAVLTPFTDCKAEDPKCFVFLPS
jgi:hypothetical protein